MSLLRAFHRPWAYLTVPAIAVCAVVSFGTLQGLAILPVSTSSKRVGRFEIGYKTYDAFGHRGTRRTLYYHGKSWRRKLLVSRVVHFEISPYDPDRVVYEYCPDFESPQCGIHYFDGRRRRSWKVSDERALNAGADEPVVWSTDNHFVVLTGRYHLRIVNLDSPRTIDMTEVLALKEGPGSRSMRLEEWSPDRRKISVLVAEYMDAEPSFRRVAEDLVVVDLQDGSASYVATAQPRGWRKRPYSWLQTPTGYAVQVAPDQQGINGEIYRKRAADLPSGMLPQQP